MKKITFLLSLCTTLLLSYSSFSQTPSTGTMEFGTGIVIIANSANPSVDHSVTAFLNRFDMSATTSGTIYLATADAGNGAGTSTIGAAGEAVLGWIGNAVTSVSSGTLTTDNGGEIGLTSAHFAYEQATGSDVLNFTITGKKDGATVGTILLASPAHNTDITLDFTSPTTGSFADIDEIVFTPASPILGGWSIDDLVVIAAAVSNSAPTVTTTAASSITITSAALGGNVTADGGATVTERGVVYSTSDTTPTIAEGATKDTNGTGTGVFSETVSSLTAGTTYYINSYAINSEGTNYGTATSFTTSSPSVTLSLSGSPLAENGGVATVTATLSAASGQTVTVTIGATGTAIGSGTDYNLSSTTITINAGSTTGTATITGVDDGLDEPAETVIVDITGVTNGTESGTQQVTASITDDDAAPTVTLSLSGSPLAENGGVGTVTATLNTASSQTVTVTISATGTATGSGTDYNLSSTTITINAGSTTGTATITGVNDALDEPAETVIVDITGVTNGTESGTQQVTASVTDDDAAPTVTLSLSGSPFAENGGVATITATLNTASSQTVTVTIDPTGTATGSGTDYTLSSTTITINAGATTGTATLTGADDAINETNETVIIDITGVANGTESGTQQVTATITDDDNTAPTVTTASQDVVTTVSAFLGGNVTADGGASVTDRGIVWGTTSNPTISNNKEDNGTGTGAFSETVTSLPSNTTIHVRAYATNSAGTSYGNNISFTTEQAGTSNFITLGSNDSGGTGFKTNASNTNYVVSNIMSNDNSAMYINDFTNGASQTFTIKADGTNAESFSVDVLNVKSFATQTFDQTSTVVFKDKSGTTIQTMTLNADKSLGKNATSLFSFFDNGTTTPVDLVAEIVFTLVPVSAGENVSNWTPTDITVSNVAAPSTSPTITFGDIDKIYGDANFDLTTTSNSAGAITYTIEGANTTGTTLSGASNKTVNLGNVGSLTIRATQAANGIYSSGTKDITLTINKATLTATADDKAKDYGDANPAFTISYSGFKNSETSAVLTVEPTASSIASTTTNVGNVDIDVAGGLDNNYDFSYVKGTLTIGKATLTVTADDKSRDYGAINPAFTISYSGFKNSETSAVLTVEPTGSSIASTTTNVGNVDIDVAGGLDNNYDFSYVKGTLTIGKATLTVTADDKSRDYGDANPAFTISYSGFKNSETSAVLTVEPTGSSIASTTTNVGNVDIDVAGGLDNNYDFSYVKGTLTIGKATLTATADDKSKD